MNQKENKAKLTLVGAGPGDPDLITLKGIKALNSADVVLYDALIDTKLLEHAPNAIHVFCGKRGGKHFFTQDQINDLIVKNAFEHGHVVRLKGGDPFVFGRGQEEIDFAHSFGIPSSIVPGITSSIAVPEMANIPVTLRGIAESFWVITATTKSGKLSNDIQLASKSTATVVVLMGMRKLNEISEIFVDAGKSNTPVAIIQNGTTKKEKIALGTIGTIASEVEKQKISSPAVIVIGEVVAKHPKLAEQMVVHHFK